MRLLPIVNQIQAQCPIFVAVGPARNLNAIQDHGLNVPAAFVHPVEEGALPNQTLQVVTQKKRSYFGVLLACRNIDVAGATEQLEDARDQLIPALLGYQPSAAHEPVEFWRGEVVDVDGALIWWRDIFVTGPYLRST